MCKVWGRGSLSIPEALGKLSIGGNHYAIVVAVFAAQLALNYPSFADVCVTIRIYINLLRQSNLGPSFWSCEALGRLPTSPKAKAGTGLRLL